MNRKLIRTTIPQELGCAAPLDLALDAAAIFLRAVCRELSRALPAAKISSHVDKKSFLYFGRQFLEDLLPLMELTFTGE